MSTDDPKRRMWSRTNPDPCNFAERARAAMQPIVVPKVKIFTREEIATYERELRERAAIRNKSQ